MEVYQELPSSPDQILVVSRRYGTNIVQLVCDNNANGYFINHWDNGHQIHYGFIGQVYEEAQDLYQEYLQTL